MDGCCELQVVRVSSKRGCPCHNAAHNDSCYSWRANSEGEIPGERERERRPSSLVSHHSLQLAAYNTANTHHPPDIGPDKH